jgi:hypothetical protein
MDRFAQNDKSRGTADVYCNREKWAAHFAITGKEGDWAAFCLDCPVSSIDSFVGFFTLE